MQRRTDLFVLVAMLAVANVMSNRVLPDWTYLPWNLSVAVALAVSARRLGLSREELGWHQWRRGAAFGATLALLTLTALLIGLAVPALDGVYEDDRVDGAVAIMLYHVFVRIPFGTVVLEELAFRSVLPAAATRHVGVMRGSVVASVLFGLWHVLPALGLGDVNPVFEDVFGTGVWGTIAAVTFAVLGTTIVGLWWCWLRHWSGSILTTIVAHVSSNSMAYALAWWVGR